MPFFAARYMDKFVENIALFAFCVRFRPKSSYKTQKVTCDNIFRAFFVTDARRGFWKG